MKEQSWENLQIRPATLEDLPEIADLLVRSFQLYPPGGEWLIPVIRLGVQEDLRQRLLGQSRSQSSGQRRYECLVATVTTSETAQLVGTVEVSLRSPLVWSLNSTPYAYLANLAVRSDYRQRGIAQALLKASEVKVGDWKYRDLYLHVMEDNFFARQLYLKAGYYIHDVENSWSSYLGWPQRLLLPGRLLPEWLINRRLLLHKRLVRN
jgi:ribosomal protein S18 acetylase RimI-like enzyme